MSLGEELSHFRDHQEEFAKENPGKFVLICNQTVEGFYDDETEAYLAGKKSSQMEHSCLGNALGKKKNQPLFSILGLLSWPTTNNYRRSR